MSGNIVLRAIEASGAGTQAGFGRLIGKAQSTVWKYVKQGDFPLHVIPDVERVTGIPRAELAPDFLRWRSEEAKQAPQAETHPMTAAIEALIRHAVPAEPPKVKGVWAIIRFYPSLATGDRLNVGVLLCVNSKQSYRLTDSAPFACLFGEAWEESVGFLLRALEEALQAGRDISHFSPHIEIDGWRPAAGDRCG